MSEYYLWCLDCGWTGYPGELVALEGIIDPLPEDFKNCPNCGGTSFGEEEEGES